MKAREKSKADGDERETPQWLFEKLDDIFRFTLDVAATAKNKKTKRFFSKSQDALERDWNGHCFMNPPFSRLAEFCHKACEGVLRNERTIVVVGIVPYDPSTWWWENYIVHGPALVIPVPFRVSFVPPPKGKPGSNPFPTAIIVWSALSDMRCAWEYARDN